MMRLRQGHTSDRNEPSSSGSLTCVTSKNLNCHFSLVSFAIVCCYHYERLPE
jgi:hypothetical protein